MKPALLFAVLALAPLKASADLPVVVERYDAIVYVHQGAAVRVYFIRDGRPMAHRATTDDMILSNHGPDFCLSWRDNWTADRLIFAQIVAVLVVDEYEDDGESDAWWSMLRNMRDLVQPRDN